VRGLILAFLFKQPAITVPGITMPKTVIEVPDMEPDRLVIYFRLKEETFGPDLGGLERDILLDRVRIAKVCSPVFCLVPYHDSSSPMYPAASRVI